MLDRIEIVTERLIGYSEMKIENGKLREKQAEQTINIINVKPVSGRESGFIFYLAEKPNSKVCHIGITHKRDRFEVSYGTEEMYRNNRFMQEALEGLLQWLKENTSELEVWGLPNGNISEHILEKAGFHFEGFVENSQNSKWYRYVLR